MLNKRRHFDFSKLAVPNHYLHATLHLGVFHCHWNLHYHRPCSNIIVQFINFHLYIVTDEPNHLRLRDQRSASHRLTSTVLTSTHLRLWLSSQELHASSRHTSKLARGTRGAVIQLLYKREHSWAEGDSMLWLLYSSTLRSPSRRKCKFAARRRYVLIVRYQPNHMRWSQKLILLI